MNRKSVFLALGSALALLSLSLFLPARSNGASAGLGAAAAPVKLNFVSICDGCLITPINFTGAYVWALPSLGRQATPLSFESDAGKSFHLTASKVASVSGVTLRFKHWVSLPDNTVVSRDIALNGVAYRDETYAAVYQAVARGQFSTVRIQVIRVFDGYDSKGQPIRCPDITPDQFRQWVDKANQTYAPASVQFLFDPATDWRNLIDPIINQMQDVEDKDPDWSCNDKFPDGKPKCEKERANAEAAKHPGKLVVFIRWGRGATATGGGFSWTDYNFVAMPGFRSPMCGGQNLSLLAHELGHYLGLPHTFLRTFKTRGEAEKYLIEQSSKVASLAGDFNGDRKTDIITFTRGDAGDVYVALSDGTRFRTASKWHDTFSFGDEVPLVADVNGDGKDDLLTFTRGDQGDVFVALSDGTKFGPGMKWHDAFSFRTQIPAAGDVNGDGKDDLITFSRGDQGDVYVALSDGSKFGPAMKWHDAFCFWSQVPAIGDVNGDGRDDLITFSRGATGDVYVSLSTGNGFGPVMMWHDMFCINNEIPLVADVNGDGKDDIISFTRGAAGDVYVATSDGRRFNGTGVRWHEMFCINYETPAAGDINGDGKADIITFTGDTADDVYAATSTGWYFAGTGVKWHDSFNFLRSIFDGDGLDDTPPDPWIEEYQCGPTPTSFKLMGIEFAPFRADVMSYYHYERAVPTEVRKLTPQQNDRVRRTFEWRFPGGKVWGPEW